MIKNTKLLLSIFAIFFISYVVSIANNSFGKVEKNISILKDKTGPDPAR
jgi:hypothetical protein